MTQRSHLPILMTLAAALFWASSFTVVKVGLRYLDPYSFVFLRFLVATALLLGVVGLRGQGRLMVNYLADRYVLLLGLTLAASYVFQFRGQTETTAANAVVIVNSSAVLVAPLSYLMLQEAIGARKVIALVMGLAGVYLITRGGGARGGEPASLAGNLLVSGSAVAYACYVVLTKMAVTRRPMSEVPMMAAVFLWSLPAFLGAALPALVRGVKVSGPAWLTIGYLAVACSILPFIIWTAAIKRIGALTSAIVLLAELAFGVVIARIALQEALSAGVVAGCGIVAAAVLVVGIKS
ncbi:MAG TPA: DMT family transporter [bacterium]|nr:DMT family transporter [bacterium]